MDDLEYMETLDCVLFYFHLYSYQNKLLFVLSYYIIIFDFFLFHLLSQYVRYVYVSTESIDCILLSSFGLNVMLLIISAYAL